MNTDGHSMARKEASTSAGVDNEHHSCGSRATFDVEFVTPCFLGGAAAGSAEWRAASIRGQLRWWYRAVSANRCQSNMSKLRELETSVWGSSDRRSSVIVRTSRLPPSSVEHKAVSFQSHREGSGKESISGQAYLGYGPVVYAKEGKQFQNSRSFIQPQTRADFSLIRTHGSFSEEERQALNCWACFGGIGARSRRGWGSLKVTTSEGSFKLQSIDELITTLKKTLNVTLGSMDSSRFANFPAFTAISGATRLFRWKEPFPQSWEAAMHAVGKSLITFRRRYGLSSDRDYAWAYNPGNRAHIPDRVGFGLPLPFSKDLRLAPEVHDRRASPLFIHIAKHAGGFQPVLLYMPAQFLPKVADEIGNLVQEGVRYEIRGAPSGSAEVVSAIHYRVVEDYLASIRSVAAEVV